MHPRALLTQFGFHPKKRFGQHFLVDGAAARRIASAVCSERDCRVLEIGAGTGALTQALVERCEDVTAINVDPDMVDILRSRPELRSASIAQADALTFDYAAFAGSQRWNMTGNLPYNIATPLIMRLIEVPHGPQQLIVMVQKEVAARFLARPSTRAYGSLTIAAHYAMRVEPLFALPPAAFYPRPKIHSSVMRLTRREDPAVQVADPVRFLQVVRAAFAYRRKTLANSLVLSLGVRREIVAAALRHIGLNTEIRGEQLAIDDFARLADRLPS